tara:strand:- start:56 stop:484 length:429 start_codon:yes stop_codon:yes gene_type:complete
MKPDEKLLTDKNVTVTAISIPIIPNKFPCLEVSGDDNPLKAKINNTPEIRYKIAERFADIYYLSFFFFLYIASILWVTKNPPKILTAAKTIAKNPKMLDDEKIIPSLPDKAAIIAPTIITDEIAFVTDIKGVCNEGVTLHTT